MIWLTWRQFRAAATATAVALAALAAVLALTGPGLADDYATGIAACTAQPGGCSAFSQLFYRSHLEQHVGITAVALLLPALVGLFWGAPLIARELEAGTHRLVWNQSITRGRWLAIKLAVVGLAAMTAAGLGSLAATWWASPIDTAAANSLPRMGPMLFAARGITPIGYAVFAFALGVTVGMLVRRTLPAMAITLAVFVAVQVAVPVLVRPNLLEPTRSTFAITESNVQDFNSGPDANSGIRVTATPPDPGAWVLAEHTVDASGNAVESVPLSLDSAPCAPTGPPPGSLSTCLAEIERLGYRQQVTYQPSSRFWPFQWFETGLYTVLALGLAGLCFWRIRRRLS